MCFGSKKESLKAVKTETKPIVTSKFKTGNLVKVIRKAKSYESGWTNAWVENMDRAVGKIGKVTGFDENGVNVDIESIQSGWGPYQYPEFVLALSDGTYSIGDKVQVKKSRMSELYSGRPATVVGFDNNSVNPLVKIKTDDYGNVGSFYHVNLEFRPTSTSVVIKAEANKPVFAFAKITAVTLAKANGTVNVDQVQDALVGAGYKSTDLGNAAGAIFRSKNWKKAGTIKSARSGNNGRAIQTWKYVGA